jgi:hypothetical protein
MLSPTEGRVSARLRVARATLALLAASAVVVGPAGAAPPQLSLAVTVSPYTGGSAPAPVTLTLHTIAIPDVTQPAVSTRHMTFDLDPSILTGFQPPAGCTAGQVITDASPCTPIGDGTMVFQTLGLLEEMTLTAYQSTDPQALLVLVDGKTPLMIHSVLTLQKTVNSQGGAHYDTDTPMSLQEPAPGAYATWTDFNLALRKTIGLARCPPSPLGFATHSDFTPGTSSADATALAACESVTPVIPPVIPPAVFAPVAHLATAGSRHRGRVLGRLLGLRSVSGMTTGTVTMTCTAGCSKRRLATRTLTGREHGTLIRLHPSLKVTKRTRITVTMLNAVGVSRVQRFQFVRRSNRLVAQSA